MNINPFITLIVTILDIYGWILIAWIVLSLLISFEIINRHSPLVSRISEFLYKATEPVLRRIRRYMPNLGIIDLSPIVVFILIRFINNVLFTYFWTY